ncbi:hypothetical protein ACNR9Q_00265 [Maribacter sp. X9]|uniref:hypothetical protein n=1 Tax=Maribacter sp. X9 TaxID=3402159 RepID=UPI003AF3E043
MKNAYFGHIKRFSFPEGNYDLEIRYLQEKSILEIKPSLFSPIYFDENTKLWSAPVNENYLEHQFYNLKPNVLQAYYNFLIKHYQERIDAPFIRFSFELDEHLYGLDKKEQKKIALKSFKKVFSTIDSILVVPEINLSPEGIEHLKSISRLDLLKKYRDTLKATHNIYDESFKNYLLGKIDFFNDSLIERHANLRFTIDFESKLKKLLSLNDRFKFEEDYYFGINNQLKERFERHPELSFNFQVFKFIYQCITNIEKSEYANVVSLYYFLFDNKIIREDANTFKYFINNEFNRDISRIKIDNITNRKHQQRIENFTDLWRKFESPEGE